MVRASGVGVAVALGVGLSGCIVKEVRVGDERATCQIDLDCRQRGLPDTFCDDGFCQLKPPPPPDLTWACLGEAPPQGTGERITVQLKVVNPINGNAPKMNSTVRACSLLDATCSEPVSVAQTDTNGDARVQLTDDFTGYFEIISVTVDATDPEVPILAFLPPREIIRGATGRILFAFTKRNVATLVAFAGASFPDSADSTNPSGPFNAVLTATSLDCQGKLAAGVSFELLSSGQKSADTKQFYTNRNFPDAAKIETDESGTFGLTNLKAGSVTVVSNVNDLQQPAAPDTSAFVRDGWITQLVVSP